MISTKTVFFHTSEGFQILYQPEKRTLSIGFTNGGSISMALSPEAAVGLSKSLWYSVSKTDRAA